LTRFNLLLWNKDKEGEPVRTTKWLAHRFRLFENYCLPSIANQTCQDFEWIILFDSTTPEKFKNKIDEYQKECPQMVPIYVEPKKGRLFADIFREEVAKRVTTERVITSYLDNDDALNVRFVEDLQQRVQSLPDGTFIFYTNGYQFFTDHKYLMKIHYPRNHFVSVVESSNPATLKTIYGYGSHYYIDKIKDARIEYAGNLAMWCEVIHKKNMGNDAYFLGARMVKDAEVLKRDFALNETVKHSIGIYMLRFLPRYAKTFFRRCKIKLRGYRFE
jgi:hypothetical protein